VRYVAVALLVLLGACKTPGETAPAARAAEPAFPAGWTVVDLTRPLDRSAPAVPHRQTFPFERTEFTATREYGWRSGGFTILDHMGTHLSAPLSRLPGGDSAERVPATQLVLPLVVMELPSSAADGGVVGAADVLAEEREHGPIPPGSVVVLRTGRGSLAPTDPNLLGRRPDGTLSFPGWGDDAIRLLAVERRVRAVGTDAMAIDSGANVVKAPAESAGSAAGIWFVAGLTDLAGVPERGAVLVVGALPVAGAGGAPARVLALVPPR
jgi:kynurenine formamidase